MTTWSSILAWREPGQFTVRGFTKSWTWLATNTFLPCPACCVVWFVTVKQVRRLQSGWSLPSPVQPQPCPQLQDIWTWSQLVRFFSFLSWLLGSLPRFFSHWVLSIQEEAQSHLYAITVKVIIIVTVLNQAGGWNVQVTFLFWVKCEVWGKTGWARQWVMGYLEGRLLEPWRECVCQCTDEDGPWEGQSSPGRPLCASCHLSLLLFSC